MKSFKTVKGALHHIATFARSQEMSECADWDKLTEEQKRLFYALLAGIQNDLGEISNSLVESKFIKKPIW